MNVSGIKVYIFWLFVTLSITVIPFCRFGSRTVERNGGNATRRRWRPPREGRMGEGIMWKVGFQFLLLLCNLTPWSQVTLVIRAWVRMRRKVMVRRAGGRRSTWRRGSRWSTRCSTTTPPTSCLTPIRTCEMRQTLVSLRVVTESHVGSKHGA